VGYANEITRAYNQRIAGNQGLALVQTAIRLWYNQDSLPRIYGPGIFVLGLSMFPPLLAALAMAKESELKTILQVYVSSISRTSSCWEILAFMVVALAECVLMLVLCLHILVGAGGRPNPFIVATLLYTFCVAAFGTMVGATIRARSPRCKWALGAFSWCSALRSDFSNRKHPADCVGSRISCGPVLHRVVRDALLQGGGWPADWWKVTIIGIIGSVFYGTGWYSMRRMQLKA